MESQLRATVDISGHARPLGGLGKEKSCRPARCQQPKLALSKDAFARAASPIRSPRRP